jgi:hypothetical protein
MTEDLLVRWLKDAIKWSRLHRDAVAKLEASQSDVPGRLEQWKSMKSAWESDHNQPNPYEEPELRKS